MLSVFSLFRKYRVNYLCHKDIFVNAKNSYRANQTVTLKMYFATDTDYQFIIDDDVKVQTDNDGACLIYKFKMPDHDITINLNQHNSMVKEKNIIAQYHFQTEATADQGTYKTITVYVENSDLSVEIEEPNTFKSFLANNQLFDALISITKEYQLNHWKDLTEISFIDGASYSFSCSFQGLEYRISSDHMPDNGDQIFRQIEKVILDHCVD